MQITWKSLNKRQQQYLQAIFEADQAQERNERMWAAMDHHSRSAETWRWIEYADTTSGHTPLKQAIKSAGLVDPGTGSTFKALADRGYILVKSEWATPHPRSDLIVHVRLTTRGRKLVRDTLDLAAPKKMVVGSLQAWHWRALAKAYAAGDEGVPSEGIGYGRIGWQTWLRLRDYKIQGVMYPLIEEGVFITPFGYAYYERCYRRYQELYPNIQANPPGAPIDPLAPYVEEYKDTRFCRACIGGYPVAVTRTYLQDQRWRWSVEEREHRIPSEATNLYNVATEQCLCREQDIQHIELPFIDLLDRLVTQNWHVRFHRNNWFYYLEYAISGRSEGQTFYNPALIKQKLLPLSPGDEDQPNIMRGEIQYWYNEQIGRGCVYYVPLGPYANVPAIVTCRDEGSF